MALHKLGKQAANAAAAAAPDGEQPGIPGSRRFAIFYQDNRQLPRVSHGEGIYLYDVDGNRYLDGCSGACAANIGHAHPRVVERARAQMSRVAFAYRTQFESDPADELADLLTRLSPPALNRVFFVNSGSEAVETAVKLARQFWWATGHKGKHMVISRRPSYHGATLGALSCTDYAPLNVPFRSMSIRVPKVAAPFCYHCPLEKTYPACDVACARELQQVIDNEGADNVAAFIAEPIGGASTGAAVPPERYFPMVERICHDNNVLLIIDDVLTGCGRTGTFYGFDHWDITPDIVAVSKGLSGGYTPIGACLASEEVVQPVLDSGGFMHGHTYAGNPLSTAIAAEVIRVVLDEGLVENAGVEGTYLHTRLRELKLRHPVIGDVRGRGLLAGVEFVRDRAERTPFPAHWYVGHEATEIARGHGLLVYPRRSLYGNQGDHLVIAPPLTIDRAGVGELIERLDRTLTDLSALLARHIDAEAAAMVVAADGTVERYVLRDDIPDYAVGRIDAVEPVEGANVTWTMQDPELEVHGSELLEAEERVEQALSRLDAAAAGGDQDKRRKGRSEDAGEAEPS